MTTVVPARAGLAGHPSDAFAGAVLAMPVPELTATVAVEAVEAAGAVVIGDRTFPDLGAVLGAAHDGASMLFTATVARLAAWMHESGTAPPEAGFRMTWQTTIPRSAGLGGSSALVIAALRSLASAWELEIDDDIGPQLALEVEADLLSIAAGPQDRLVQWHESTLLMEFASRPWSVQEVRAAAPLDLVLCWSDTTHAPSQSTHGPLQARREEPGVRAHMAALAALARDAAAAVEDGDVDRLGRCMDEGFEHRRALVPLDAANVEIVEQLRNLGAAATYAGSGGAVVALAADLSNVRQWADERELMHVTTTLRSSVT